MNIDTQAPRLGQKVALVTGANTGIGRTTALALAREGAHVFLACRSEAKTKPVIEEIKRETKSDRVEFLELDLTSLDSVRGAARAFLARELPLHLLINNAGVAGQRGITQDGFELHFGVNHLGHFLLTQLLLERLRDSAPARIVNVSSGSHYQAKEGIDFDRLRASTPSFSGLPEYAVSKLANVLHARALAKRLAGTGVTAYSLHPGVVASDAWRRLPAPVAGLMKLFMISNEDGARTTLHCALSERAGAESGLYYDDAAPKRPSRSAESDDLAEELWRRSEQWLQGSAVGVEGRAAMGSARGAPALA